MYDITQGLDIVSPSSSIENTRVPFDAGSLRMTEADGLLYIHSCHEMYPANDGLNHQANMNVVIDEESMTKVDSAFEHNGYVSHSFDQFIQTDGEYIYQLDLGDAYPRGVYLQRFSTDPTSSDYESNLMQMPSTTGNNFTGVSLGGFKLSENNCIIAGESYNYWDEDVPGDSVHNIFVNIKDKNLNEIQTVWLTNYVFDDSTRARTPHLAKISENKFMVMWEEKTEYMDNWDISRVSFKYPQNIGDLGNLCL